MTLEQLTRDDIKFGTERTTYLLTRPVLVPVPELDGHVVGGRLEHMQVIIRDEARTLISDRVNEGHQ